jgi:glycosyltransferase involved in cell wall biosynthesis
MQTKDERNMAETPLVSVVIPAYNAGRFVADAVRSVLAQTYTNVEVVVIDDGSTDDTRQVMEQFAGDPRVRYHHQPNAGVSSARNSGIQMARGEFIGLCDADDLWMPNKLELQLPCFSGRPELGVVYCKPLHVDINDQPLESYQTDRYSGKISDKLLLGNFVTGSTSLIRKECFDAVGFYDTSLKTCEDYDLWLRISTKYEFFYLDQATYRYRQWDGQVSVSRNEPQFYEDAIRVKRAFLAANPGLARPSLVSDLWAGLYSGRAQCVMRNTGSRVAALVDIFRSLTYRPLRLRTWKAAVKVLINRVE